MAGELRGRAAVVTGAAKGIGRACARRLAAEGARVAVVDVDEEGGAAVAAELAGAAFVPADVSRAADAERVAREVREGFGRLDVLVNNAGIQRYGTVADTPEDVWDEVLAVNLKGVYLMSRACVPLLLQSGGGAIVNVASVQGLAAQRRVAAYAASKGGVLNLTRSMAVDLAPQIRVNAVCPGSVDTPMLRWAAGLLTEDAEEAVRAWGRMHPLGRVATPEEVAEVVTFLAGPRASFVTGALLLVDGGLLAQLPGV